MNNTATRLRLLRMKRLPIFKRFEYKPTPTDRLSRCLTELRRLSQGIEADLDMDGSGDCGPLIQRSAQIAAAAIARKHGFQNADAALDLAERRTHNYSQQLSALAF